MNARLFVRTLFLFAALVSVAANSGFAKQLTPITELPNPKIIGSATAYHDGRYGPQNILMDGGLHA